MNKKNKPNASPTANEAFYDLLFNATDQGFALLKKIPARDDRPLDFEYIKVNQAFERHAGVQDVVGKTVRDIIPTINSELVALIDSVTYTGKKVQFEEFITELDTWFSGEVFPTAIGDTLAFLFNNITERKLTEAALQESKARKGYLLKLSDELRNIADPVQVQAIACRLLGEHLAANQVHYGETVGEMVDIHQGWGNGLPPMVGSFRAADFGKRLQEGYRAGRTQVCYNVHTDPTIAEAEQQVISGAGFNAYVAVPLIKNYQWVATLAVHNIEPRVWTRNEIELVEETAERTWDAVERAVAEASLRESESRYKNEAARLGAMLTSISDAVYIGDVSGITFANQAALDQLGYANFEELNRNIGILSKEIQTRDAVTHEDIPLEKQVFARALAGEHAVRNVEVRHRSSGDHRVVRCAASPVVVDGQIVAAVAINTDITEQWQLTLALQESEERFRSYVMAGSDFVFTVSPDWQRMKILKNDLFRPAIAPDGGNWMANYIPDEHQEQLWQLIGKAILEKKMFDVEHEVTMANGQTCWMHCRALPVFDFRGEIVEWRGAGTDITIRKKAAQQLLDYNERLQQEVTERTAELQAGKDQFQSVLDTTLVQMSILEAVRDQSGHIIDLEIKLVNKELEKATGRADLGGKKYAEEYPGIRQIGLFDLIVTAIETGQNQQMEYHYAHEGLNRWFSSMFVKLGDGVVATNIDITDRKNAEEERFKNYLLLQQSEDLALLGSWDYERETGQFLWSDGMYRLFDLAKGTTIQPEIYLQYATAAGLPAAERVVKYVKNGETEFEETLEIDVDGQIKLLRLKAMVVKNAAGDVIRVLGVDMDVTALRAAEETIRQLEAEQQKEILRVSLTTVEEERQRISESLHNGLGQLLYGIKINLSPLSREMTQKSFDESKKYAHQLLTDAIKESRRISHELMPTVLEDFGLKVAIEDICQQLQDGIKLKCEIKGIGKRLDKYLELAIYRTAQELMTNVIKHAKATHATITVTGADREVKIRVSDNGQGIQAAPTDGIGIGLASIRSKISLLNGRVDIASDENGTTIEVIVPV